MGLILLLALQDVDRWVRDLGDDDPAVREAATARLEEAGEGALAAVRRAAASKDPEVASRAAGPVRVLEIDSRLRKAGVRAETLAAVPGLARGLAQGSIEGRWPRPSRVRRWRWWVTRTPPYARQRSTRCRMATPTRVSRLSPARGTPCAPSAWPLSGAWSAERFRRD